MKKLFLTFVKFGIVGTIGTVVDFFTTAVFMLILGMKEYISESVASLSGTDAAGYVMIAILLANLVGFIVAATTNFFLNRIWTWKSKNPDVRGQYLKFFAVSVGGLLINLFVIYLCNRYLDVEFTVAGLFISKFWVAKVVATSVVMFWNFIVNHLYTFKSDNSVLH